MGMQRTTFSIAAVWLGLWTCVGCAPDTPGQHLDVSQVDTVEKLFRFSLQRYCDEMFACAVPNDDSLAIMILLETPERCLRTLERALAEQSFGRKPRALMQLEAEGRLHVNVDIVQRCYAHAELCASPTPAYGVCREAIEGVVPQGDACRVTEECAGEAYCDFSTSMCPGTCKARVAPGETCQSTDMCRGPEVAYCDWGSSGTSGKCVVIEPVPVAKQGEPCTYSSRTPYPCARGLFCDVPTIDGKAAAMGRCVPPIAMGASCDDSDDVCEPGAICHGPSGAMTCQRVQRLGEGSACKYDNSAPPRFCDPFAGLTCGATNCERVGDGTAGARCGTSDFDDFVACNAGLFCNRDTASCEALRPAGASCESHYQCTSGSCDGASSKCRDRYCAGY